MLIKRRTGKFKRRLLLFAASIMLAAVLGAVFTVTGAAGNGDDISIDELLNGLDTSEADEIVKELDELQKDVFGADSFKDKLQKIVAGEDVDASGFVGYLFSSVLGVARKMLPLLLSVLGICVAFGAIDALKGNFASSSVSEIIRFACITLVGVILFAQVMSVIKNTAAFVTGIKKQIEIIFPLLLTLMTAIGSSKTAGVYQPAVAFLGSGLTEIITVFVLPCFILGIVLEVVGSLSDKIKLKNLSSFFGSAVKWTMTTAFFVFLSFLSIKGITASIYDNIYIRTTKFALKEYIPLIGGYLSEGYNLVIAGSVIIKNGIGLSAVILLFLSLVPLVVQILVLSLSLDLLAALVEPVGAGSIAAIFSRVSKGIKTLLAVIFGVAFLYFIFVLLVISTGNVTL